jgi:hypothetical protein
MRADVAGAPNDLRGRVQQRLLLHGDLILNRNRGGRGRAVPIIQYCPVCRGEDGAYLRRGWRFSLEVACFKDGCFLLDACGKCAALVAPLSQTVPAAEFLCVKCSAPLAKAPSLHLPGTVRDQEAIYVFLARLAEYATYGLDSRELDYIETLSTHLRGTNPTDAASRHHVIMVLGSVLLDMPAAPTISEPRAAKLRLNAQERRRGAAAKVAKRPLLPRRHGRRDDSAPRPKGADERPR